MTTEINKNVYYVGDLCYVMTNEWDEICDLAVFDNDEVEFTPITNWLITPHGTSFLC